MAGLVSAGAHFRDLKRSRQVALVLVKYGFGQILDEVRLWEQVNIGKRILHRPTPAISHLTQAQRLRMALEELGPTFVKIGQFLSTRPDLVPADWIPELEQLQSGVAPIPSEVARSIIEAELGHPVEDVFASFEDEPIAAASISQVHRATLPDNQVVAIKVQRPGIAALIDADLHIMLSLARLAERHLDQARLVNVTGIVREFSVNIRKEINFTQEASNLRRVARNFGGDTTIHVPAIHDELCTRRVMVMEYIEGINISRIDKLRAEGYDLHVIAQRGVDIAFKSTFEHGFFHADPHPGNIFVLPGNVICLLDYGMMGSLPPRDRDSLARLAQSIVSLDEKTITRALLQIAKPEQRVDVDEMEGDVSNIAQEFANLPLSEISLGDFLNRLFQLIRTHRLRFRPHLIWLLKAISTIENVARQLIPDYDMVEAAKPYATKLLKRRLSLAVQARELSSTAIDLFEFLKELPQDTREILHQLKEGRLKIELEHGGLEPAKRAIDRGTNRMVIAIIIAAILVGSSLVIHSGMKPVVADIPVIGLIGFIFSVVFGLWLVLSILRSGGT